MLRIETALKLVAMAFDLFGKGKLFVDVMPRHQGYISLRSFASD